MSGPGSSHAGPPVPLGWRFALALLARLPQGFLSRLTGWLAERTIPRPLRGLILGGFARMVGADPGEAEAPPAEYRSVSAFFSRRLRRGVRSWPEDPDVPASPVDGIVGRTGRVVEGTLLQAKGRTYRASELLAAGDPEVFEGGWFVTLYLSPRHYHRIHAPLSGQVYEARAVPGRLLPVNPAAVAGVPRLFPRNERLVARLRLPGGGETAVVAVGAFNVGRISARFDPEWAPGHGEGVTNRRRRRELEVRRYQPAKPVARGEEIMAFHLGSTVVVLFSEEVARGRREHPDLEAGGEIRVGRPLMVSRHTGS